MLRIENRACQWIAEHGRRLVEGHAVVRQVPGRLGRIPLELHEAMIRLSISLRVGFSDQPVEGRVASWRLAAARSAVSSIALFGGRTYWFLSPVKNLVSLSSASDVAASIPSNRSRRTLLAVQQIQELSPDGPLP